MVRKGSTNDEGDVIFDPAEWKGKSDSLTIDQHKLTNDKLMSYAAIATNLRRNFGMKASSLTEESKDPMANEAERELNTH